MKEVIDKVEYIKSRLSKDFPDLTFIGDAYTIKMLDDDLNRVLSLIGKAPECDSGSCQFESGREYH